jgi:hypothetical protein
MLKSGRPKLLIITSLAESGPKYSVHGMEDVYVTLLWFYLVIPLFTICLKHGCSAGIVICSKVSRVSEMGNHTRSHTYLRSIEESEIFG